MNIDYVDLIYLLPTGLLCVLGLLRHKSRSSRSEGKSWLVLGACVLGLAIVRIFRLQEDLSDWGRNKAMANDMYESRRDVQVAMVLGCIAIACVGFQLSRRGMVLINRSLSLCIAFILWLGFLTAVRATSYHYSDEVFGLRVIGPLNLGGVLDALGLIPLTVLVIWRLWEVQNRPQRKSRHRSKEAQSV